MIAGPGAGAGRGVGVVVVHYGDPAPTRRCLDALAADGDASARVVVVDNGGGPPLALPGAEVLACPDNPGFGAGANRGVEALGAGPWSALVVLNHDVEIHRGFLAAAAAAVSRPGVGAAGGPLWLPDGRLWYGGGGVRVLTGTVWQERRRAAAGRGRAVGFVPGAAMALAPAAWRAVGGFDPRFFLYQEDLDLGLRLRRSGWALRFEPGMAATHHLGAATGSAARSPLYLEQLARNRLRPFRPLAYRLYLAFLHTGWVAVRALGSLARPDGAVAARAVLRGHLQALAGLREGPRPVDQRGPRP